MARDPGIICRRLNLMNEIGTRHRGIKATLRAVVNQTRMATAGRAPAANYGRALLIERWILSRGGPVFGSKPYRAGSISEKTALTGLLVGDGTS